MARLYALLGLPAYSEPKPVEIVLVDRIDLAGVISDSESR